jgi:hypothetical protein
MKNIVILVEEFGVKTQIVLMKNIEIILMFMFGSK